MSSMSKRICSEKTVPGHKLDHSCDREEELSGACFRRMLRRAGFMPCVPRQGTQQTRKHVVVKRRQQIRRAGAAGIFAPGTGFAKNHILPAGHRPHRINQATAAPKKGTGQGHVLFVPLKGRQSVNQRGKPVLRQPVPGVTVQGQHFQRRYGYGLPATLVASGVAGCNTPVAPCSCFHAHIYNGIRVQQKPHAGIAAFEPGICMPEKPSLRRPC